MEYHKKLVFILLVICAAAVMTIAVSPLHSQEQASKDKLPDKEQQRLEFESQFPIADLNQTEAMNPEERARRSAKGKKFNGHKNDINENMQVISSTRHWATGLPALPTQQSDIIIIGNVKMAHAFITDERSAVYSEFEIEIETVLKNDASNLCSLGTLLTADREGGRVRMPSGQIGISFTDGMGMPRVGKQYVFFLTHQFPYGEHDQDYYILTAYELIGGHIIPIDNPGGGTHPIASKYKNTDETTFLNDLRLAIERPASNPQN